MFTLFKLINLWYLIISTYETFEPMFWFTSNLLQYTKCDFTPFGDHFLIPFKCWHLFVTTYRNDGYFFLISSFISPSSLSPYAPLPFVVVVFPSYFPSSLRHDHRFPFISVLGDEVRRRELLGPSPCPRSQQMDGVGIIGWLLRSKLDCLSS